MGLRKTILCRTILAVCILTTSFYAGAQISNPALVLVGSTPGDKLMKSMLRIPVSTTIDFIRWTLSLMDNETDSSFTLHIVFGIGQPNTTGFMGGGKKLVIKGSYTVSKQGNEKIHG